MNNISSFMKARVHVLENVIQGGDVSETLDILCRATEDIDPAMRCSVLYFDQNTNCLRHAAAPNLPDYYNDAIDGLQAGIGAGSCGTAAFTGERVIVEDVFSHPYWEAFRDLAKKAGFHACWSQPIYSSNKDVLGTFAMYYDEVRQPTEEELQLILAQANLASLVIERKRTEEALLNSEQEFRSIFNNLQDVFYRTDTEGRIVMISPSVENIFGYTPEELIGRKMASLYVEVDDRTKFLEELEQGGGTIFGFEAPLHRKDGHEVMVSTNAHFYTDKDGQIMGVEGITRDITERNKAEEELRAMREQAEKFLEGAADAIISVDANQNIIAFNRAAEVIFGYTKNEVLGEPLDLLLPKGATKKHAKLVRQFEDSKQETRWMGKRKELHGLRKNGETFFAEASISKQDTSAGLFFTAILKDITKSRQAENALRESEERFKDFTNATSDWFWEMGPDLRFTSYSPRVEKAIGVSRGWLIGKTRQEQGRPEIDDEKWIHHLDALKTHKPFKDFEYSLRREDGTRVYVRASGVPVFGDDGDFLGYRGTGTNITDRIQAEAQLIQSSKLATLGQVTTGMAHELNQPLNITHMAAETLLEMANDGDIPAEVLTGKLERILDQTDRASAIINHMRTFGRTDTGKSEAVDLKDAVLGAAGLISEQLRLSEIKLIKDLPEICRKVTGYALQLEQVILNLLTNARDAIEAHATDGNKPQRITVSISDDPGSEEVSLSVQDTGGGIPDEVLDRIFEPFFTTKEVGQGTGLGLSISYSIITGMGGRIEAVNVDGGAKFTIIMPTANKTSKQDSL